MRLVITGANGFIGRRVVAAGLGAGHEVTGIVRSPTAADVVAGLGADVGLVRGFAIESLDAHLAGAAAVIHLAGIGSERAGAHFEAVNVEGTRAVARACRAVGVPRIVYVSGLGVAHYGRRARTTNRYFLSKLGAEVACFESGLETFVFRPSYVLGPDNPFVDDLLSRAVTGAIEIPGDGRPRLQPISVLDAADALIAAASGESTLPYVFDLVGPETCTLRDFVAALRAAAGLDAEVVAIDEARAAELAAAGGFYGMGSEELDCLLCDETADAAPLATLLGRPLTPLAAVVRQAVSRSPDGARS